MKGLFVSPPILSFDNMVSSVIKWKADMLLSVLLEAPMVSLPAFFG